MNSVLKTLKSRKPNYLRWLDDTPIHKHDCHNCEYLGRFINRSHRFDLYYHADNGFNNATFIARYGDEEKYSSGFEFLGNNDALQVAFARKIIKDYM